MGAGASVRDGVCARECLDVGGLMMFFWVWIMFWVGFGWDMFLLLAIYFFGSGFGTFLRDWDFFWVMTAFSLLMFGLALFLDFF